MMWQIVPIGDGFRFVDVAKNDEFILREKIRYPIASRSLLFESEELANEYICANMSPDKFKSEMIYGSFSNIKKLSYNANSVQ